MPEPIQKDTTDRQGHVSAIDVPGLQLGVKELQDQDPSLEMMLSYLRTANIPDDQNSARKLISFFEDYLLEEDVLYHLDKGRARTRNIVRKQLVVPRTRLCCLVTRS